VLILSLTSGLLDRIEQNPAVPPAARERIADIAASGIPVVPVDDVEQAVLDAGASPEVALAIAGDYGDAQLFGLKQSIGAVAVFALLSLWFTRRLPAGRHTTS
jgi:hypothetical protein